MKAWTTGTRKELIKALLPRGTVKIRRGKPIPKSHVLHSLRWLPASEKCAWRVDDVHGERVVVILRVGEII